MKTDRQVMEEVIAILEKEGAWCQRALHLDADGNEKSQDGENVVSHCIGGALEMVLGHQRAHWPLLCAISDQLGGRPVVSFNDDPLTTQEDVILVLKRTLEDMEG